MSYGHIADYSSRYAVSLKWYFRDVTSCSLPTRALFLDIACVLRQLLSWFNLSFNRLKYFLIQSFNIFLSAPPVEMHRLSAVSGWLRKNNFQDCRVIKTPGKCFVHHTSKYKGKYLCSGNNHVIKHLNFHFLIFLLSFQNISLCVCLFLALGGEIRVYDDCLVC